MNIQIASDLHLEFHKDKWQDFLESFNAKDVDVLVVAGDLCTLPLLSPAIDSLCARYRTVVYVAGNHEYYGASPREVYRVLASLRDALPNFYWLNNELVEIAGLRFAGTTLWFPDDPSNAAYEHEMSDFGLIREFKPWVYQENVRALEFLERATARADVVVTHHLPSERSVVPRFEGDPLNRFFLCPVDDLIRRGGPTLWIHGHTHDSVDHRVGVTRVVCNPLGYAPWCNPDFDEKLVVRIGS